MHWCTCACVAVDCNSSVFDGVLVTAQLSADHAASAASHTRQSTTGSSDGHVRSTVLLTDGELPSEQENVGKAEPGAG